ncbi:MAG: hypothetical protein LBK06_05630 [Planctomycetaceae bacterium]|jgi:hypothetical protein|nr:hypothetical protein [Planctomycetaceae bacterium]
MEKKDFVPDKDDMFYSWANTLFGYITPTKLTAWSIPTTTFNKVRDLQDLFNAAYEKWKEPNSGHVDTVEKNKTRAEFEKALRIFVKSHLTYNQEVTDIDRATMVIPIHKTTRDDAPIPITYPIMEIITSMLRRLIIHFRDQNSTSKAKPFGVHGAEIRWAILDTPPVDVKDIVNSVFCTHSPCTLEFEEHDRGKRIYLVIRWENTRGQKGPWSPIESVIIP